MTDHVHTHGPGGCGHTIDLPTMPLPTAPPPEDETVLEVVDNSTDRNPLRAWGPDGRERDLSAFAVGTLQSWQASPPDQLGQPFRPVIDGDAWFSDELAQGAGDALGIHKVIREVVDARRRAVDRVLQAALDDGRYGVTVDDDGVRIDTDVPAGTIRYAPPGRKALTGEWRADATVPARTVHRLPPIPWGDVHDGDTLKLERALTALAARPPTYIGKTNHTMTARVWRAEGVLMFDAYSLDYLRSEGWSIVELVGER